MKNSWQGENWNLKVLYSRAGVATQILVSTEEYDILVDVGDGTLRDLLENNYDFNKLEAIAITHGHYDHMGGLWSMLGFLRMLGRSRDLTIISPKNCNEVKTVVYGFLEIYEKTMPYKVILKEVVDGEEVNVGKMIIQAFQVIHRGSIKHAGILEPIPAVGYSIKYGNQRIVVSGDTGFCERLVEFVEGADLAVIEATSLYGIPEVHLSISEAMEIGKRAREYILIHKRN